jgi:hypothetical protein
METQNISPCKNITFKTASKKKKKTKILQDITRGLLLINTSFNVQIYGKCLMCLQLLLNFATLTTLVNLVDIVSTTNKDIQVTMQNSPTSSLKL